MNNRRVKTEINDTEAISTSNKKIKQIIKKNNEWKSNMLESPTIHPKQVNKPHDSSPKQESNSRIVINFPRLPISQINDPNPPKPKNKPN